MTPADRYQAFLDLHTRPGGFVMPNAWDGLSALILKEAGFKALGTSSAALAAALGRPDGRHAVSRAEHLAHAELLARVSGLPINGDFEDGYGDTPDDVAATVRAAVDAGLAGIGVEDTTGDPSAPIRDFDDAVARVRAAADAARGQIVLTGRTDNFLHGRDDVDDTIRRLTAFAEAGADVLYAPNPPDLAVVRAIVSAVAPKPVNVVRGTGAGIVTVAELQQAGVKRISMGSALYTHLAAALRDAAARLAAGDIAAATTGMSFAEMSKLIAGAGDGGARVVSASREIAAGAEQIFELIADPSQQPRWDGNDNLAHAADGQRVHGVGDMFTMTLTMGVVRENHIVEFEEGRRIAWRPAEPGQPPPGHLWRWELESLGARRTRVTHTYDWSQLTDESRFARARSTTAEMLMASLGRLAALAENP